MKKILGKNSFNPDLDIQTQDTGNIPNLYKELREGVNKQLMLELRLKDE